MTTMNFNVIIATVPSPLRVGWVGMSLMLIPEIVGYAPSHFSFPTDGVDIKIPFVIHAVKNTLNRRIARLNSPQHYLKTTTLTN